MRGASKPSAVPEDLTLDAFVAEDEATGETGADHETAPEEGEGRPVAPTSVSPAVSTSIYDPAGARCAACEATVKRRFRAPDGYRCAACLDWSAGLED